MQVKKLFQVLVVGGALMGLAAACNNPPKETDDSGNLSPQGNPDGGPVVVDPGGAPGW